MLEILVVDDDVCMCQLLSKVLRTCGHKVSCARDGDEALDLVALHPFDAVLCDLRMPRMDGLTLLKKLRELHSDAAVVLMTAHADVKDAILALREGVFDFLLKPMPISELTEVLAKIHDLRAAHGQLRAENETASTPDEVLAADITPVEVV